MHIAILPASPKTAQATIRTLLNINKQDIHIKAFYRDLSRVPASFLSHPNFHAVKGDVGDANTLDLTGIDAVLVITPPVYDGSDYLEHARLVSQNTRTAIQKAGVKRVVLLSSAGAEHESGTGEILTNHTAETILRDSAPEVVLARCAYFMENWATGVATVRSETPHLYSCIVPRDFGVPMVAVKDMARAFVDYLLASRIPESPFVVEVQGPREYTSVDVQRAFEEAIGKEVELRLVQGEDLLQFFGAFLPKNTAEGFVEMTRAFLPGGVMHKAGAWGDRPVWKGETELRDVVRELCEGSDE
ncbi:hypothetical protein ETB97_004437 [Aspergillus alliaceus]|uniref:NAD(P)-binding domain-containing protein n=1 Tax=Petromyces alliaceus TaxID=209559 RepID=A0A8H5ZYY6_PETAA|nr:hypothetical protein ETB97_004437 [Aspergillus burnettii]